MDVIFHQFGTVQVLTVVLLLQLFVLHAIVTGRIVRILRLIMTLPLIALGVFLFVAPPTRLNHQAEKQGMATSEPNQIESSGRFAPVSTEQIADTAFKTASEPKRPTPIPLQPLVPDAKPATSPPLATESAALAVNAERGTERLIGEPQPLALGGMTRYDGSQHPQLSPPPQSVSSENGPPQGWRNMEFTTSEPNSAPVSPVTFQSGPGLGALKIPTGTLEMSRENSLLLWDRMTDSMRDGVKQTRPAIVHIEATVFKKSTHGTSGRKSDRAEETGGGVIVSIQGVYYVFTNNHVVGNAVSPESVKISLSDGRVIHPVRVLPCPDFDIALLELAEKNLPSAQLGDSNGVKLLDTVVAVGSPFGLSGSTSRGSVSGLHRREIPLGNEDQIQDFIQTDAAVNPGNSGGPLLNVNGQVIGIVTAIATNSGGNEGVAFAIPINHVRFITPQLITHGVYRRPYLGVGLDEAFGAEQKIRLGLRKDTFTQETDDGEKLVGAKIGRIDSGSPADAAGLKAGDILLRYNGLLIEDTKHFFDLIGLSSIDDRPEIGILRGAERLTVRPRLGKPVP